MTRHPSYQLRVFPTTAALNEAAAEFIIAASQSAIASRKQFTISLSGGETPKKLYALLAEPSFSDRIDWKHTFIFWGDERCVPLDDERNNAYQAISILLSKIDIPSSNIHPIPVNLPPATAACVYEQELKEYFGNESSRFDLVLLGLGENGHTASLFPGTKVIKENEEAVREVYVEEEKMFRITMTAPLINKARNIIFLVTGENKSAVLRKILNGPFQPDQYPAQLIKPYDGELFFFADRSAATLSP